ncbi:MAG: hypothetical protein ABI446_04355 [Gemmatimonadaceae bacterium]
MNTRARSLRQAALAVALAFVWVVADCACSEKASVALPRGSACERGLLTPADVAGILRGPIIGAQRVSEDRESCAFTTRGRSRFEVTLRPSHGAKTVDRWIDGGMVLEAVPLHGVGDRAAWQRDLHEVIAEKNDVLCDIAVMGTEGDFVDTSENVLQLRIGDLCNKLLGSAP